MGWGAGLGRTKADIDFQTQFAYVVPKAGHGELGCSEGVHRIAARGSQDPQ